MGGKIAIATKMEEFVIPNNTHPCMMALACDYKIIPVENITIGDDRTATVETDEFLPIAIGSKVFRLPGKAWDTIDNLIDEILTPRENGYIFHFLYGRDTNNLKDQGAYDIEKAVEMKLEGISSFMLTECKSYCVLLFPKSSIKVLEDVSAVQKVIRQLPMW